MPVLLQAEPKPRHWTPARFFRVTDGGLLCTLCPHACVLDEGEDGFCGVRRRRGDRLETATFASSVRHMGAWSRSRSTTTVPAPGS